MVASAATWAHPSRTSRTGPTSSPTFPVAPPATTSRGAAPPVRPGVFSRPVTRCRSSPPPPRRPPPPPAPRPPPPPRGGEGRLPPVGGHDPAHVLRAPHPPLDLERGEPQRNQLGKEIDQGKVAGGKNRLLAPRVPVETSARLDARPAVAALSPEEGGEETFPRGGVAHRPVDEDLDSDAAGRHDPAHLGEVQV